MGLLSGLLGGGESKSSTSTQATLTDNRSVTDASHGGAVATGNARLTVIDGDTRTAQEQTKLAAGVSKQSTKAVSDANERMARFAADNAKAAFDFAKSSAVQSAKNSADALGDVVNAFKAAKGDQGQGQRVMMTTIVVAGCVAVAFAFAMARR